MFHKKNVSKSWLVKSHMNYHKDPCIWRSHCEYSRSQVKTNGGFSSCHLSEQLSPSYLNTTARFTVQTVPVMPLVVAPVVTSMEHFHFSSNISCPASLWSVASCIGFAQTLNAYDPQWKESLWIWLGRAAWIRLSLSLGFFRTGAGTIHLFVVKKIHWAGCGNS